MVAVIELDSIAGIAEGELIGFDGNTAEGNSNITGNIAAVLPILQLPVVDTDSPGYSDDECTLFSCSHLFWLCHLASPSPSSTPMVLKGLIDDGSSVVLIKEAVVKCLQLSMLTASGPFQCKGAFSSDGRALSLSLLLLKSSPYLRMVSSLCTHCVPLFPLPLL